MAFNANFLSARVDGNTLTLVGHSKPLTSRPIMVTLEHLGQLHSHTVAAPDRDPWEVEFGPGEFTVGDVVHATGVAATKDKARPFVWQERLELVDRPA